MRLTELMPHADVHTHDRRSVSVGYLDVELIIATIISQFDCHSRSVLLSGRKVCTTCALSVWVAMMAVSNVKEKSAHPSF